MNASDLMTENPVTVTEDTSVADVVEILRDHEIRHLPVLRGTELVGMISDRDLKSVIMPKLVDAEALDQIKARFDSPVSRLMVSDVVSVSSEAEVREVVELMLEHKIGAVPVVDAPSGDLLGIVSYVDVLRATFSEGSED